MFISKQLCKKNMEITLYKQRISTLSPVLLYYLTNNLLNLMKQEQNKVSNKNVADKVHNIKKYILKTTKTHYINNIKKHVKIGPLFRHTLGKYLSILRWKITADSKCWDLSNCRRAFLLSRSDNKSCAWRNSWKQNLHNLFAIKLSPKSCNSFQLSKSITCHIWFDMFNRRCEGGQISFKRSLMFP